MSLGVGLGQGSDRVAPWFGSLAGEAVETGAIALTLLEHSAILRLLWEMQGAGGYA